MGQLAKLYGVHRRTVAKLLGDHDVPLRRQGIADDQLANAARLYAEGWSLAKLAARYDCMAETVRQALMTHGVTMRWPWERGTPRTAH